MKSLIEAITQQDRELNAKIKKFIGDHCGKDGKVPHRSDERAKFIFQIMIKTQG